MQTYDYRIPNEAVDQAGAKIDKLSGKDRLKLAETAKDMQQAQEAERFVKAKESFTNAVLPGLKDFAEMSGSLPQCQVVSSISIEKNRAVCQNRLEFSNNKSECIDER